MKLVLKGVQTVSSDNPLQASFHSNSPILHPLGSVILSNLLSRLFDRNSIVEGRNKHIGRRQIWPFVLRIRSFMGSSISSYQHNVQEKALEKISAQDK